MKLESQILLNAFPAFILLIIVETIYMAKERRENSKDILTNVLLSIVAIPISFATKGMVLYCYTLTYELRLFNLPANVWYTWLLCFFCDDFSYYWFHRMSHKIRFMWVSHVVHHSSETISFSTALRVPWTGHFTGNFLFWAWMPLIGIEPSMVFFLKTASIIYQFWMHTEAIKKLPCWFEYVFNTPSHHRVHHGSNVEYLDKNHAGTLIIWDRLFGTYLEETTAPTYGLTTNVQSKNPVAIEFYGWKELLRDMRRATNAKQLFNYLFNAPGWSHDNSTRTAKQLQADMLTKLSN